MSEAQGEKICRPTGTKLLIPVLDWPLSKNGFPGTQHCNLELSKNKEKKE